MVTDEPKPRGRIGVIKEKAEVKSRKNEKRRWR